MAASSMVIFALRDGVHADGERFGHRRDPVGEPGRHLDRHHLVEHHQLGVATGVDVREPDGVKAAGVERDRHRHDDVADRQVVARRPELDHFATELVTHHEVAGGLEHVRRSGSAGSAVHRRPSPRSGVALLAVLDEVQVAAADPAGQHLGQHLTVARCRVGDVVDSKFPVRITAARMRRTVRARAPPPSNRKWSRCRAQRDICSGFRGRRVSAAEVGDGLDDHGPTRRRRRPSVRTDRSSAPAVRRGVAGRSPSCRGCSSPVVSTATWRTTWGTRSGCVSASTASGSCTAAPRCAGSVRLTYVPLKNVIRSASTSASWPRIARTRAMRCRRRLELVGHVEAGHDQRPP